MILCPELNMLDEQPNLTTKQPNLTAYSTR